MLGSFSEADDAVQEAWVRLDRSDTAGVDDLRAWVTTVVARVCLDMLRTRRSRREARLDGRLPEPIVVIEPEEGGAPDEQALMADSVGVALLVVLETLTPTERLAFVLHDMFAVPFPQIAEIIGRSPAATRQLVSRARRRVQGASPVGRTDRALQRRVVDAFLAASRAGDFDALLEVLDPDVVFRIDPGRATPMVTISGAADAASVVVHRGAPLAPFATPALVNGAPGAMVRIGGRLLAVTSFTVVGERITGIDIFADPERLPAIDALLH
jgi:RNA polymerase sigma-70 factor (ECF subfamily)